MTLKKNSGFTLVEMLVVIAIISVLAAALFPAINGALGQAQATALKNKGRGIWLAITASNTAREPLNMTPLWPSDVKEVESSVSSASAYFTYLLSDGEDIAKTTSESKLRIVEDLSPESLIANGVIAAQAGKAIEDNNIAWGVVAIRDTDAAEIPFLISRNYNQTADLKYSASDTDNTRLTLDATVKPFGDTRAVWVTRGGGIFDTPTKYFTNKQLMGVSSDSEASWEFWAISASSN